VTANPEPATPQPATPQPATPETSIDARFSSEGASPTPWPAAAEAAAAAELWWVTTVRADGRPHVTPLLAVWQDGALHFCTGPTEQKSRNLEVNPHCSLVTGSNEQQGLDLVVEGRAVRVTEEARLRRLAAAWVAKYGEDWRFDVRDGAFVHGEASLGGDGPSEAHVFEVRPTTAFGFGKGETFSQTRWRF
jgi:general stress protein 26